MKTSDILACSFSCWYPLLEKTTFRSLVVPLPKEFIDYLLADNLVLPKNTAPNKWLSTTDDESEDDDWDQAEEDTPTLEAPSFEELDSKIKAAIAELGGQVFVKLNWSSPKDAAWISLNSSLKCHNPTDVYLLLKSSDFVQHDLTQPFKDCDDEPSEVVQYELVLRKWAEINPENEFRCFVRHGQLVAISQREDSQFYSLIVEQKDDIVKDITSFYWEQVAPKFPLHNYVFDVVRYLKDRVRLVDFNPFGPTTDSLLFDWDAEPLSGDAGHAAPELRHIGRESSGIRPNPMRRLCVPLDFQHLTTGEDPYKMLDLLNLPTLTRTNGDDDDDEEDEGV